jgi:hypothetical protein
MEVGIDMDNHVPMCVESQLGNCLKVCLQILSQGVCRCASTLEAGLNKLVEELGLDSCCQRRDEGTLHGIFSTHMGVVPVNEENNKWSRVLQNAKAWSVRGARLADSRLCDANELTIFVCN